MARQETLAAVDLGSNSFHLEIGRVVERQIYPLDAVREVVRLGGGLTADKRIDRATQAAALDALRKFAERLRGLPRQGVRAVGTNALRVAMKAAELAARQELAGIVQAYRAAGWHEAVGSSGTARSLENILRENGFAAEGLTREGLERLRALLVKHERADADRIAGLRANRAPVLPGGVAIMKAVLDELGIEAMKVSEGALRHGVRYDLLGRVEHRDMREVTVAQFVRRYHVDAAQAERMKSLSLTIYDALTPGADREEDADRQMLEWAARLAETGLSIEHA